MSLVVFVPTLHGHAVVRMGAIEQPLAFQRNCNSNGTTATNPEADLALLDVCTSCAPVSRTAISTGPTRPLSAFTRLSVVNAYWYRARANAVHRSHVLADTLCERRTRIHSPVPRANAKRSEDDGRLQGPCVARAAMVVCLERADAPLSRSRTTR